MNSGVFLSVGPYFSPYSVIQLRIPIDVAQQTELEMESPEFQFNILCVFVWGGGFFPKLLRVFVKAWLFPQATWVSRTVLSPQECGMWQSWSECLRVSRKTRSRHRQNACTWVITIQCICFLIEKKSTATMQHSILSISSYFMLAYFSLPFSFLPTFPLYLSPCQLP